MKHNFHTHTTRCKHASGSDEMYVKAARKGGFDVLGFADHAPWRFATEYVSHCRMPAEQWPDYKQSILALKEKYQGQISIHLGLECEYYPRYMDQLYQLRDDGCEYFILGNHFLFTEEHFPYVGSDCIKDDKVKRYAEMTAEAIATGLYSYVAHPDLFMMYRQELTKVCMEAADTIGQAAKEAGIPLEYNLLGLQSEMSGCSRGYPNQDFWKYVQKWDTGAILGVDAHEPAQLTLLPVWNTGVKRLNAMGHRLVDTIFKE